MLLFWLPGMVCLLIFTLNLNPVKFPTEGYTEEELKGFDTGTLPFYPNCRCKPAVLVQLS